MQNLELALAAEKQSRHVLVDRLKKTIEEAEVADKVTTVEVPRSPPAAEPSNL